MRGIVQKLTTTANEHPILKNMLAALTVLILIGAGYVVFARPYQLGWGATPAEVSRPMPGDEINPAPSFLSTRAITINGKPEEIWPWLIQMGYGRAGYYGYDILENLGSPLGIQSADHILPEFQGFTVGDPVPISAVASMRFYAIEPYSYLIWAGEEENPGAFTWALYPGGESSTRLVSRIRWSYHPASVTVLPLEIFTEFADHLAVRKILQGVKGRVEGQIEPVVVQNIEFFIFLGTLLIFLAALLLITVRGSTWRTWRAVLLAGVIWLVTWYAPIPAWTGALSGAIAIGLLYRVFRRRT